MHRIRYTKGTFFNQSAMLASVAFAVVACGGTDAERPSRAIPGLIIVDDMEDNNAQTLDDSSGYFGYWYTFNDGCAGTQTPPAGSPFAMWQLDAPPSGSPFAPAVNKYGARTNGTAFPLWGAGMGVDLNGRDSMKLPFDASAFQGIGFWLRGAAGQPGKTPVRLNVHEGRSSPDATPLMCTFVPDPMCGEAFPPDPPADKCSDHLGADMFASGVWQWCAFGWNDMKGPVYDKTPLTAPIDASKLYAIQFKIDQNLAFDVVVDTLSFLETAPTVPGCAPVQPVAQSPVQ